MSDLVDPDKIEDIVGVKRHPSRHIGRWVTSENKIYILHPDNCAARLAQRPLTECYFSRWLDYQVSPRFDQFPDVPVILYTSYGGISPLRIYHEEGGTNESCCTSDSH